MERTIQNIVFDMGGVLFHTDRLALCMEFAPSGKDAARIESAIFDGVAWLMLDRGTITLSEAEESICGLLPTHLHGAVHRVLSAWHTVGAPIPGMDALIRRLKAANYGIYLLSNTADTFHSRLRPLLPAIDCFDGTFISADCHLLKPDPAIYRAFLAQFSLSGRSCLFVDDSIANVEAAIYAGIPATPFYGDASRLMDTFRQLGMHF